MLSVQRYRQRPHPHSVVLCHNFVKHFDKYTNTLKQIMYAKCTAKLPAVCFLLHILSLFVLFCLWFFNIINLMIRDDLAEPRTKISTGGSSKKNTLKVYV